MNIHNRKESKRKSKCIQKILTRKNKTRKGARVGVEKGCCPMPSLHFHKDPRTKRCSRQSGSFVHLECMVFATKSTRLATCACIVNMSTFVSPAHILTLENLYSF